MCTFSFWFLSDIFKLQFVTSTCVNDTYDTRNTIYNFPCFGPVIVLLIVLDLRVRRYDSVAFISHQKMTELEESLAQERDLNDSLTRHLDETRGRDEHEADVSAQLQDAEAEIDRLRQALRDTDNKLQVSALSALMCL